MHCAAVGVSGWGERARSMPGTLAALAANRYVSGLGRVRDAHPSGIGTRTGTEESVRGQGVSWMQQEPVDLLFDRHKATGLIRDGLAFAIYIAFALC